MVGFAPWEMLGNTGDHWDCLIGHCCYIVGHFVGNVGPLPLYCNGPTYKRALPVLCNHCFGGNGLSLPAHPGQGRILGGGPNK